MPRIPVSQGQQQLSLDWIKILTETLLQFANVFSSKAVRWDNVYPEKRTKGVFNDDLPASIQSAVKPF